MHLLWLFSPLRPTATELLKHQFFKKAKGNESLVQSVLEKGPSLAARTKKVGEGRVGGGRERGEERVEEGRGEKRRWRRRERGESSPTVMLEGWGGIQCT